MEEFRIQIITSRDDGCFVDVKPLPDNKLSVSMVSKQGNSVTDDCIRTDKLAEWISDHHDW